MINISENERQKITKEESSVVHDVAEEERSLIDAVLDTGVQAADSAAHVTTKLRKAAPDVATVAHNIAAGTLETAYRLMFGNKNK